jgi:hypothetical protein
MNIIFSYTFLEEKNIVKSFCENKSNTKESIGVSILEPDKIQEIEKYTD